MYEEPIYPQQSHTKKSNEKNPSRSCPTCGSNVPSESQFCPTCGDNIEGAQKSKEKSERSNNTCSFCGKIVSEKISNCPRCGSRIESNEGTSNETPPPPTQENTKYFEKQETIDYSKTSEESIPRNCPNCGSEVPVESKFCPSCGKNIEETNIESRFDQIEKEIFCPSCGNELNLNEIGKFCPQCGENLSHLKEEEETKEETDFIEEKVAEKEIICPNCDGILSSSEFQQFSPFCPLCGEEIIEPEEEGLSEPKKELEEGDVESQEQEEITFEDEDKKRYKEKIDEWKEFGFEVSDLEDLLIDDRMDEFESLYRETKKQIEGE